MLSAAQMLDELMGRDRNLAPTEKRRETHWEDAEVCKYFLCGFCPHELFTNTRADLGPCEKLHDEKLKTSYEQSTRHERMGYEEEFMRFLQSLLADVERRIRKGQARLCLNNTQGSMASGPQVAREEKISMLTEKINDLVQKAEELGCEGKVEDAQGMMKLCEQLTEERSQLENSKTFSVPPMKEMELCEVCGAYLVKGDAQNRIMEHLKGKQHMGYARLRETIDTLQMQTVVRSRDLEHAKDMQVCEICGALLVVGDAQQRVDEHLLGKQHMGYAQIRSYVETRKEKTRKKLRGEDEEREAKLAKEREEREKEREEREKEREERRKKREQEEKERAERRRHRSRSRSKSRSKRRSRSRSSSRRHRRSRSRDRHSSRRSRSRDRRRDRSRSRDRRRDRSRERSHRSSRDRDYRSRDKDRDRDRRRSRSRDRSSRKRDDARSTSKAKEEKMDVSEERKEDDGSGDCKPVVEGSDQFTATDTALPEPVKPEQAEEY